MREKNFLEMYRKYDDQVWGEMGLNCDLDPNATCYILTDGIDLKKKKIDYKPHAELMNELVPQPYLRHMTYTTFVWMSNLALSPDTRCAICRAHYRRSQ